MHKSARAVLAIWHDISEEAWEDTIGWYDREHHVERVCVPGFLSARRYQAIEGAPQLFIRYETESLDVLTSAAYLERVNNPTSWTLRAQPTFRNYSRTVCAISRRAGTGEGGIAATIRLPLTRTLDAPAALRWDALAERLTSVSGLLSAELWIADKERSALHTREKELRGVEDHYASVAVVLHGTGEEPIRAALAREIEPRMGENEWGQPGIGIYRLAFSLGAQDAIATA